MIRRFFQSTIQRNLEIEVVWGIGDSHTVRRSPTGSAYGPDCTAYPIYNWQLGASAIYKITNTDIEQTGAAVNSGSFWPQYGIDRHIATGRMIVFVTTGVPGSNYSPRTGDNGDWTNADVLWSNAKDAYDDCIAYLALNYPTATIYSNAKIILGVNDAVGLTSLATIQTDITAFYDRFETEYPGLQVGIVLPGREPNGVSTARLTAIRSYLITEARNRSNTYVVGTEAHLWSVGLYDTDNWHLLMTGNTELAHMMDRWDRNDGYDKWARAIIACCFDELSSARKTLINNWRTTIGNIYFVLEYFYMFKTTQVNNIYNSWALLGACSNPPGASPTFTANSYITTNGINQYLLIGHVESVNNIRASSTDFFDGVKVATNRTPAGTLGYLLGAGNSGPSAQTILAQNTSNLLVYRAHDMNTATFSDTRFLDDTFYAVYRNGTTKGLNKNGSSVASVIQAAVSDPGVNKAMGASLNNATPQNFLDADYLYSIGGQFTTVNLSTLYAANETLTDGW